MERYIDVDLLIEELKELQQAHSPSLSKATNAGIDLGLSIARRQARKAPTADVVEVKHGEWVKEGCGLLVCNKCKFEYAHAGMPDEGLNYCPNCGAKMDGGEAE